MDQRIYRRQQLPQRTGLSVSTIYDLMAAGRFPKPIAITEKARGWREVDILEWERRLVEQRDAPQQR